MNTKKFTKFVCLLFTLLLALSVLSLSVFAAEDEHVEEAPADSIMDSVEQSEDIVLDGTADDDNTVTADSGVTFEPINFVKNLKFMGAGMLGIFIVIGVIILSVIVLNKVTAPKKDDSEA